MKERTDQIFRIARILIWAVPVLILFGLLQRYLTPFGSTTLRCDEDSCDTRVSSFASREPDRVIGIDRASNDRYRMITRDPVNIDLELFRSYERADVSLTYQTDDGQEHLQLGFRNPGGRVDLIDLADRHPVVTYIENKWQSISDGSLILYQNPSLSMQKYTSVEEFFEQFPERSQVRSYRTDLRPWTKLPEYQPVAQTKTIMTSLRGSHTFLIYAGRGEGIDVTLHLQELNRYDGADNSTISVRFGDQELTQLQVPDDGIIESGRAGPERQYRIQAPTAVEGVYSVLFEVAVDDVFIRTIETSQSFVTISDNLFLAGNNEYRGLGRTEDGERIIWFKGENLAAGTTHTAGLQTIMVDNIPLVLSRVNEIFSIASPDPNKFIPVKISVQDVELSSLGGQFALTQKMAFPITNFNIGDTLKGPQIDQLGYILARHRPPNTNGNWLVAEHSITNLSSSRILHFSIVSKPPLIDSARTLKLKEFRVTLHGSFTWTSVKEFFRTIARKVTTGT